MVIFHSYVSLPEGIASNFSPWHSMASSIDEPEKQARVFPTEPSPKKAMCALRTESSIIDHLCRILKARDNVYSCTADNFGRIRDDLFLYERN